MASDLDTVNALHEHNGGKNPFIAELFEEMDIDLLDFQVPAHTVCTKSNSQCCVLSLWMVNS